MVFSLKNSQLDFDFSEEENPTSSGSESFFDLFNTSLFISPVKNALSD